MTPDAIRALTLTCLAGCAASLLWPPAGGPGIAAAMPVAAALFAGFRPARRWGGWVAALMIPYLTVAVMNILAGPMSRTPAIALGVGSALAFVAGLAWMRSIGATLKG